MQCNAMESMKKGMKRKVGTRASGREGGQWRVAVKLKMSCRGMMSTCERGWQGSRRGKGRDHEPESDKERKSNWGVCQGARGPGREKGRMNGPGIDQ